MKKIIIIGLVLSLCCLSACSNSDKQKQSVIVEENDVETLQGNFKICDESGEVLITVEDVKAVEVECDSEGEYAINVEFTEDGTDKFSEITKSRIGENLSIYVDNVCICSPSIADEIDGGNIYLYGGFDSYEDAEQIVKAIRGNSENGNIADNNKATMEVSEELSSNEEIPEHITQLYEQYDNIISQGDYDIRLGEKVGIDSRDEERTYYRISLCPSDPDILSYPYVQFMGNEEYTDKSFSVYILDDCDNVAKKEIIYCTLLATNPNASDKKIKSMLSKLVNSYDGYSQSDVVELGEYKYFLSPNDEDEVLEVVSKEEINTPVDKTKYKKYTLKQMQAKLNQGEKVVLTSKVVGIYEDDYSNYLLVGEGESIYYIHYSSEKFAGIFKEGKEYTFYGEIATPCEDYVACMGLEYVE